MEVLCSVPCKSPVEAQRAGAASITLSQRGAQGLAQQCGCQPWASRSAAHQAKLNLSYTKILAPVDGMIAQRSVQVGNYMSVGAALMAVVPLSEVYIEANYRGVQLGRGLNGTSRSRQRSHEILDRSPLRRLWDLRRITEIKEPH
jgi:multidrug resistance efflux pump